MTRILIQIFMKNETAYDNPAVRGRYGSFAGIVGIICNIFLFAAKMFIGMISKSVSITADAVNNLSDASSSIMTLIGFKLSQKPADEEHPYGHARFEYLSGLGVAALIMIIGYQLARNSIDKILHPAEVEFSTALVIVLVVSIAVKLWMAYFNQYIGSLLDSTSLKATAADSRNDVISTSAVLLAAVVSYYTKWNLDGFIGLLVALFILYSSIDIAKDTISPLIGESVDEEMERLIYKEITEYDDRVLGVHDLMVHNYGPGQRFASVHVEVDRREDVLAVHEMIDNIERIFYDKYNIHMVIHYDPMVMDDEEVNRIRALLQSRIHTISSDFHMHDFWMVYCDGYR